MKARDLRDSLHRGKGLHFTDPDTGQQYIFDVPMHRIYHADIFSAELEVRVVFILEHEARMMLTPDAIFWDNVRPQTESTVVLPWSLEVEVFDLREPEPLPLHRSSLGTGYGRCSTCDGGGCPDCTDPA